ncbi:thioredoxin [Syncephalastrum racemosum]|uniref:Thioredoxin n=1 Tax=Syncephalastrum racemosum TaxID=13706 RepID=A0A1X2H931_SYNRA|nr:thioredoxin [Syncephalastrum racemosum]
MRYIKDIKEFQELINRKKVTAIHFTAEWSGPCRVIGPLFEELAEIYQDYTCLKVDMDDAQAISREAGVKAMPTFKFYFDGEEAIDLVGTNTESLRDIFRKLKQLN